MLPTTTNSTGLRYAAAVKRQTPTPPHGRLAVCVVGALRTFHMPFVHERVLGLLGVLRSELDADVFLNTHEGKVGHSLHAWKDIQAQTPGLCKRNATAWALLQAQARLRNIDTYRNASDLCSARAGGCVDRYGHCPSSVMQSQMVASCFRRAAEYAASFGFEYVGYIKLRPDYLLIAPDGILANPRARFNPEELRERPQKPLVWVHSYPKKDLAVLVSNAALPRWLGMAGLILAQCDNSTWEASRMMNSAYNVPGHYEVRNLAINGVLVRGPGRLAFWAPGRQRGVARTLVKLQLAVSSQTVALSCASNESA